jgi:AraC-like DNA-binding protein
MSVTGLRVVRDHHPAGEYAFVPDQLTLSLVLGSALTLEQVCEGRLWLGRSTRGAVNVMPRGSERVFRHHQGCSFACVTIPDELDGGLRPWIALRDEPLRLILESLVVESAGDGGNRMFRDAIGHAVVARLLELERVRPVQSAHGLPPVAVSRVTAYLDAHLADDLSVEDLSSIAGLRPAHFSTLFRTTFGEPPHQHLIRLRVERAQRLLERGADPSDAALAVGFYDQSHLARHMRRLLGVTPGQIAKARRSTSLGREQGC